MEETSNFLNGKGLSEGAPSTKIIISCVFSLEGGEQRGGKNDRWYRR